MHSVQSVASAIFSLSALYISDYVGDDGLLAQMQHHHTSCNQRLQQLLKTPTSRSGNVDELIALVIVLSMLDVSGIRERSRPFVRKTAKKP